MLWTKPVEGTVQIIYPVHTAHISTGSQLGHDVLMLVLHKTSRLFLNYYYLTVLSGYNRFIEFDIFCHAAKC